MSDPGADPAFEGVPLRPGADPPLSAVRRAVEAALAEDLLPLGDITASLVPAGRRARARVVSRQAGVVAGRLCAIEVFKSIDPQVEVRWLLEDGSMVAAGSVIAHVEGPLRSILSAERSALNFLCHLSGVATAAARLVEAVRSASQATRVLDTRKTTPGLRALEKAAVRAGGAWNHRGSLSEAILVKDNHLGGVSIAEAVALARQWWPGRMVEVECDTEEQMLEAARVGASAVLLDNMTPAMVARCVGLLKERYPSKEVLVEVSGGVTLENAAEYAAAGADLISVGAMTHSARALDIGLDLEEAF
jgi:nicotinate-nucleotide pyrophosphorylase (carboxylating)